jgi:hypothetical protein
MSLEDQLRRYEPVSAYFWTINNVALPQGKKWDFKERRWQIPIFHDNFPRIVSKKSAQVGETTIFICKALWFMEHNKVNVIWTFPRQDDTRSFFQTRFMPILSNSTHLSANIGREKEDPQSQSIMKYKDSFIYFQEASVDPRMISADMLANDEVDRSNLDNLDAYIGRMADSAFKIHYRFSTPTVPNFGIDAIFNTESDMRYWMVKCPVCNHYQSLKWDANFMMDSEDQPYYGCEKCRGVLTVEAIIGGEFVAMYPSRLVHGYHVTGMMMPISKPPLFMQNEYKRMTRKNFFNLYLGETYETRGMTFDSETVLSNVYPIGEEPYPHMRRSEGPTYMGVDQKGDLHVVIAQPVEGVSINEKPLMRLIHAEVIKRQIGTDSWRRLSRLMDWYNVRFCVHDATPNEHNAQEFREAFKGKVGLKYDSVTKSARLYTFDEKTGKLLLARTQNFDGFLESIKSGNWRFWGTRSSMDPTLSDIVAQCGNLKRDEEERTTRAGGTDLVGIWRKTGPDDFAHAWAYCHLAFLVRPSTRMEITLIGGAKKYLEDQEDVEMVESPVWPGLMVPKKKVPSKYNIG